MSLIYPSHAQIARPRRLVTTQKPQILEPQGSVWGLTFNGTSDAVDVRNLLNEIDVTQGTICARAKWGGSTGSNAYIFGHFRSGHRIYIFVTSAGVINFGLGTSGSLSTGVTLSTTRFQDLMITWDSGSYAGYVDGVVKTSGSYSGLTALGARADIGAVVVSGSYLQRFKGVIDSVCAFDHSLSAIESKNFYEKFLQPDDLPGLIGDWRFQEGFGIANGTPIEDLSVKQNPGDMQGFSGTPWVNIGVT